MPSARSSPISDSSSMSAALFFLPPMKRLRKETPFLSTSARAVRSGPVALLLALGAISTTSALERLALAEHIERPPGRAAFQDGGLGGPGAQFLRNKALGMGPLEDVLRSVSSLPASACGSARTCDSGSMVLCCCEGCTASASWSAGGLLDDDALVAGAAGLVGAAGYRQDKARV